MFTTYTINLITWIGFIVTVLGFLVAIWGIYLTYQQALEARRQALDAKNQASEAKSAAMLASQRSEEALKMVRSRTRLSALSSAVSQTDVVITLVNSGQIQAGRAYFTSFRRDVQEAIAMSSPDINPEHQKRMETINKILSSVTSLIDSKKHNTDVNRTAVIKHIGVVSDFLIEEESKAKSELK